jgi:zinc protease
MTLRIVILLVLLTPALLIASEAQIPESNIVILKNESPLIAFRILFRTGSASDLQGKEGVAALTAAMLAEGSTTKNDYENILKLLFPMAASYSQQVDKEMTVFIGVVHQDHWKAYYQLLKEAILNPAFKPEDFERLKSDQLNSVAKLLRFNDDEELGKEVLNWVIYKNHPYGHPDDGMVSSIRNLNLSDVKDFYRQQYTRNNLVLGVAGNAPAELIEVMRSDFATLPEGSSSATAGNKFSPPPKVEGVHAILIEKQTAGTAISFGFPISFTRADEDFYPMMMMNAWLGQHRNQFSHLFKVMRGERGLNYGDYSYIEYFPYGGRTFHPLPNVARHLQIFQVWIRPVQHPNRHFALRQAIRELKVLIDKGITQQDFELTRTFLQNYTVNLAQTVSEQLGYALDDRFYGLSQPFLEKVRNRMTSMSREQVNEAIRKHLNAESLMVAAVTQDASSFKKALVENAPSPIEYDSPKPQEILNEDKEIMNFPLAIKSENVTIVPVDQIFE